MVDLALLYVVDVCVFFGGCGVDISRRISGRLYVNVDIVLYRWRKISTLGIFIQRNYISMKIVVSIRRSFSLEGCTKRPCTQLAEPKGFHRSVA